MKPASADQMRAQMPAHSIFELRQVDDVRNNLRIQAELFENLRQVSGWHHELVSALKHAARDARPTQMIPRLTAAIVNQGLLMPPSRYPPRGKWRQQKGSIGGREDVRHVHI